MARKSRTLVSPGQGGCWKQLFQDPIRGTFANKPFINRTILTTLVQTYLLDDKTLFEAVAISGHVI